MQEAIQDEKDLPTGERVQLLNTIENPEPAVVMPGFDWYRDEEPDDYWKIGNPFLRFSKM